MSNPFPLSPLSWLEENKTNFTMKNRRRKRVLIIFVIIQSILENK